jgi:hypothetical protein
VASADNEQPVSERAKELLADHRQRIALDAFVNQQLRATMPGLSLERFPVTGSVTQDDFVKRVAVYETLGRERRAVAA